MYSARIEYIMCEQIGKNRGNAQREKMKNKRAREPPHGGRGVVSCDGQLWRSSARKQTAVP